MWSARTPLSTITQPEHTQNTPRTHPEHTQNTHKKETRTSEHPQPQVCLPSYLYGRPLRLESSSERIPTRARGVAAASYRSEWPHGCHGRQLLHYVVSGRSGTFCHAVTRPRSSRRCQGACTLAGRGVAGTLGIEPGPRHGRASPQGACTLCGRGVAVTPGCPLAEGARVAAYGARLGGGQRGRQWRGEAEGLVAGASAHGSWR